MLFAILKKEQDEQGQINTKTENEEFGRKEVAPNRTFFMKKLSRPPGRMKIKSNAIKQETKK